MDDNELTASRCVHMDSQVPSELAITSSHQQNTHDFANGRKNMNDIFSVAYRYRKSISIIELFVSIYIGFLATNF